jgi:MraZ protein
VVIDLKTGSSESTLDDKGRVNIPVRFREHFQGKLYITRGKERCAEIMPLEVFEQFVQREENSESLTQRERAAFRRKYFVQAESVELDKAGRIAIPAILRKYANITKDCLVMRDKERLFIWDSNTWESCLVNDDPLVRAAEDKLDAQENIKHD